MHVTFIPSKAINSDLGIVNAARVSLAKWSDWDHTPDERGTLYASPNDPLAQYKKVKKLSEVDTKLIHYLAKHNHWTPFGHSRLYFEIDWKSLEETLYFYKHINSAGMAWVTVGGKDYIKGSLYSWSRNIDFLSTKVRERVYFDMQTAYPVYYSAMHLQETEPFTYDTGMLQVSEAYVVAKEMWKLATATLLVKVPIFIARQIRTSQVGFSYSDLYVEGESFCFNEVSRRYVNSEPEFYTIPQWRVREGSGVKQGSTGIAEGSTLEQAQYSGFSVQEKAQHHYLKLNRLNIAPEQLRALLPQSMYTEFYMTGTLHRWAQWLILRLEPHVQEETQYIASRVLDTLRDNFPQWVEAYWTKAWAANYIEA